MLSMIPDASSLIFKFRAHLRQDAFIVKESNWWIGYYVFCCRNQYTEPVKVENGRDALIPKKNAIMPKNAL